MSVVSIFGLGYVGTVTAACLASRGQRVIGVDTNPVKVQRINEGLSPIVESGVEEMIARARGSGSMTATTDARTAMEASDISFVSVGTPSLRNGKLDLSHILSVCTEIGRCLKTKTSFHCVVIRSTVLPGTTESVIVPALEAASGKRAGLDFEVCFNPEFLREGTAVPDFFNPPFTVIGTNAGGQTSTIRGLYESLPGRVYEVPIAAAEMVKYACNAFHALKIAFANEVGTICSEVGVDPHTVADIFKSDTRLNIATAYLSPGFAFGGSCLPKDLRALIYRVSELDLTLPLLQSILTSNTKHIERAVETILALGKRRIGILGLSFKAGTDDLRESPLVHLVKALIAEGCHIQVWDDNVSLGRLIGSNRQFIETYIPHIGSLLRESIEEIVAGCEVLVLATSALSSDQMISRLSEGQYFIDLTNLQRPVLVGNEIAPVLVG